MEPGMTVANNMPAQANEAAMLARLRSNKLVVLIEIHGRTVANRGVTVVPSLLCVTPVCGSTACIRSFRPCSRRFRTSADRPWKRQQHWPFRSTCGGYNVPPASPSPGGKYFPTKCRYSNIWWAPRGGWHGGTPGGPNALAAGIQGSNVRSTPPTYGHDVGVGNGHHIGASNTKVVIFRPASTLHPISTPAEGFRGQDKQRSPCCRHRGAITSRTRVAVRLDQPRP